MLYVFFAVSLYLFVRKYIRRYDRYFSDVFFASTMYFGVLGPWYWLTYEQGYFLGKNWSLELVYAQIMFGCIFIIAIVFLVLAKQKRGLPLQTPVDKRNKRKRPLENIMLGSGGLAALYVMINSGSFQTRAAGGASDPLLLILYQFSDILIPLIIFRVARAGYTLKNSTLTALFFGYAIYLGLRYKIVLLAVPLIFMYIQEDGRTKKARLLVAVGAAVGMLGLFSIMTFARSKFGGLALSNTNGFDTKLFLDGFFAETNIVFGLTSILNTFPAIADYVFLTPIADTLTEFIPRYFFPDKHVGRYLAGLYTGLGGGTEATSSGTAYPFFAEYFMMGGFIAVLFGLLFYFYAYHYFSKKIIRFAVGDFRVGGLALLAIFWGYYYFSRGFTPQLFKGVLFVIVPYILLIRGMRRSERRTLSRITVKPAALGIASPRT